MFSYKMRILHALSRYKSKYKYFLLIIFCKYFVNFLLLSTITQAVMTISDRFSQFLKKKRLTQREFCKLTGYGYASITKFMSNQTTNPGVNLFVLTKHHFPELNIEWLISGEGNMWSEEINIEDEVHHAPDNKDHEVIDLGKTSEKFVGKVYSDLLRTKDKLIEAQEAQIDSMKEEIKRLKEKK